MIISERAKIFLEKYLPEYEKMEDIGDLLYEVNNLIVLKGMVHQEYLNDFGAEAQLVYDELYDAN